MYTALGCLPSLMFVPACGVIADRCDDAVMLETDAVAVTLGAILWGSLEFKLGGGFTRPAQDHS